VTPNCDTKEKQELSCCRDGQRTSGIVKQEAQLSQRDRAAGCVSFGQKWKNGTERRYFADIICLPSTTV